MNVNLSLIARALVAENKGILAADESNGTIAKRFSSHGIPSTKKTRRDYREILLTTTGIGQFISGVILYDETLRQQTRSGTPFPELLLKGKIVPGIKVDKGVMALAGFPGESVTEGLDGLRESLAEYRGLGAGFAKWRAVITIGEGIPTKACIEANAHALARYAALCQESDMVPIVEPEVLINGAHTIQRCEEVTTKLLKTVFRELKGHRVLLGAILLKPSMVIAGDKCPKQSEPREVADATVRCLRETVPEEVPGIVFLSGGQTPAVATENLQAMNVLGDQPWELSYSYGRALQADALEAWKGEDSNVAAAQQAFLRRARLVSAAREGKYSKEMETSSD